MKHLEEITGNDIGASRNSKNRPIRSLISTLLTGAIIIGGGYFFTKTYTIKSDFSEGYKIVKTRIFPAKYITYEHDEIKNIDKYYTYNYGVGGVVYTDLGCDGKIDKLFSEIGNYYERDEDPRTEEMFRKSDEELAIAKRDLGIDKLIESE